MPPRKGLPGLPRDYVAAGGAWPKGPFRAGTPPAVLYAAHFAEALDGAVREAAITRTQAAKRLDVARATIYDILTGITFPDLHTIAKAEQALDADLLPRRRHELQIEAGTGTPGNDSQASQSGQEEPHDVHSPDDTGEGEPGADPHGADRPTRGGPSTRRSPAEKQTELPW